MQSLSTGERYPHDLRWRSSQHDIFRQLLTTTWDESTEDESAEDPAQFGCVSTPLAYMVASIDNAMR